MLHNIETPTLTSLFKKAGNTGVREGKKHYGLRKMIKAEYSVARKKEQKERKIISLS